MARRPLIKKGVIPRKLNAKGGTSFHIKLDLQSLFLLKDIAEHTGDVLSIQPSTSVIVRRPIRLYVEHIRKVLSKISAGIEELKRGWKSLEFRRVKLDDRATEERTER
jgi:hypothetical protein